MHVCCGPSDHDSQHSPPCYWKLIPFTETVIVATKGGTFITNVILSWWIQQRDNFTFSLRAIEEVKTEIVVCFLLGNYPASWVYMPTFRNTLSVRSSSDTPPPCHSPSYWLMLLRAKPFPVPFLILVHSTHTYLPMKMEQTECSETSAYKLQTPGNYPKESIQHTERGESLKLRRLKL